MNAIVNIFQEIVKKYLKNSFVVKKKFKFLMMIYKELMRDCSHYSHPNFLIPISACVSVRKLKLLPSDQFLSTFHSAVLEAGFALWQTVF